MRIARGEQKTIPLGCLDTVVDIGYAREYMEAVVGMMERHVPDDFVIGTGVPWSIFQLVDMALGMAGVFGSPQGFVSENRAFAVPESPLVASIAKAKKALGFKPLKDARDMARMLVDYFKEAA